MIEWQIIFISGFFAGWIARALTVLIFNKFTKRGKHE